MRPFLIIFMGVLGSAGIGALAAILVAPAEAEMRIPAGMNQRLARLESRVQGLEASVGSQAGLETEVRGLRAEIAELRRDGIRAADPGSEVASAGSTEEEALGAASLEGGEVEEKLREMVADADRKRMESWGNRFAQMAEQREKAMLDGFQEKHQLSSYQRERMDAILTRRRAAIGEFFRSMFSEGGAAPNMEEIRKKVEDVRKETDEELKTVLTPEQFDAFQEQERSTRRGPPWMGGGGERSGR